MTDVENADQYESWNGPSGHRWVADADRRDLVLASVADALLARTALRSGDAVLDVGCGCGATTLAAAEAVGPSGTAWGIDLSAPMLEVARARAAAAGLANVTLVQGDAQGHALPAERFDVAISRFGTMFFADPAAAFTNVARALRPDGRLAMATWGPLVVNEWLTVPGAALLRYGTIPEPGDGPGMFAQSDPDDIAAMLDSAGYRNVDVEPVEVILTIGADVDQAADYLTTVGVGRAALDTVPDAQRPAALDAVRDALAGHLRPAGVQLGAQVLVTRAHRAHRDA
jgi:SAM-dependent methyltransferase